MGAKGGKMGVQRADFQHEKKIGSMTGWWIGVWKSDWRKQKIGIQDGKERLSKWEDFSSTWGITREDIEKGLRLLYWISLKGK